MILFIVGYFCSSSKCCYFLTLVVIIIYLFITYSFKYVFVHAWVILTLMCLLRLED